MEKSRFLRLRGDALLGDLGVLVLLGLAVTILHLFTNGQYGFHRDELATLDDARYLDWGYIAYPPVTPFVARVAMELFGPSMVGVRLFVALAQAASMVLAGLMARELGGGRRAQIVAALAVATSPISLIAGVLFQYVSFDYLWWVSISYLAIRLLKSGNPRYWLGIGALIGLGMMTKYTVVFLVAGIVAGVVLTRERRHLASPWLWAGVALSLLIFLPNLVWQAQHSFISLEFLGSIHARDVRIGRADDYLIGQLFVPANPFTIPLWIAGLSYYLFRPGGKQYRMLGWMYVVPFLLFLGAQGRNYYLGPAYPMLFAAGAVFWERWLASASGWRERSIRGATWGGLAVGAVLGAALMLPIAPVNSGLWNVSAKVHDNFVEQIGWPDLVDTVAAIYSALPPEERSRTAILAGNYGEAGAVNLYGPARGLPEAISGVNSYWPRGYGDPPPQTTIVIGFSRETAASFFDSCDLAGKNTNRYGVKNEETTYHPDIFVCRKPRQPWPELWKAMLHFG